MRNSNSGSFKIESDSPNTPSINSKDNNYIIPNYEEIINSNDNFEELNNEKEEKSLNNINNENNIDYEKKMSTRSTEEIKYEKNKDFPILKDYKQEKLVKTFNQKNNSPLIKKNIYNKDEYEEYEKDDGNKLNINELNNYIEKQNKKSEKKIKELKPKESDIPESELKISSNSYKRKNKKEKNKNNLYNDNFNISTKKRNDFTLGKNEKKNEDSKSEKEYLKVNTEYKSTKSINNYTISTNYLKNNYLIIQPRNSPVITELDFSKNRFKNMKGKIKNKNNYQNSKYDKLTLYNKTIDDVFNSINIKNFNKDVKKIIRNNTVNNLKGKRKEYPIQNYHLIEKKRSNKDFNNSQKLEEIKNNLFDYNKPLKTENTYNLKKCKNYYPNNFDFSEYIRLHSLNRITPKNNFGNIYSYSFKKF